MVEAGGVGTISCIDNTQLIDFWRLTIRNKLTNHGFHTRNTHTEFHCLLFAPPRLNLRHRHVVWGSPCAGVSVTAVGMVHLTGGTSCIEYRLGVGSTSCASPDLIQPGFGR